MPTSIDPALELPSAGRMNLQDVRAVGHKFARLASMRYAGFPVPPLYCVPVGVFDAVIGGVELPAAPTAAAAERDPDVVRRWSADVSAALVGVIVPDRVADRALALFDRVIGAGNLAAVRACVVPAENQPGEDDEADPGAGLSDSFLYVSRDELLDRIVACWRSAYRSDAAFYRLRRNGDPVAARVAVGVQSMALGTRSFVAFTRDPVAGSARHVIAAGHGIGEGVVQEKADVDHFFVRADTGETRAEVVAKHRMVGPGGTVDPVPAELVEPPALDAGQVSRVVALADRIEAHFGCPQDIEGTFTADGLLWIVQARPIVLPDAPVAKREVEWSNHNITESYPGVCGALTFSVAKDFYRLSFADLYRRMGVPRRTRHANAHHLDRMIGMLDGRVFYRLEAWYALHGQLPVFDVIRGWWEHGMGLGERPEPTKPRVPLGLLHRMAVHPFAVRDFLRWWDATAVAVDETVERGEPDELVDCYRGLWAQFGEHWGVTLTNTVYSLVVTVLLETLLRRWVGEDGPTLLLGLLAGGRENRSLAGLRSAMTLAELLASDERTRADVLSAGSDVVWRRLVAGDYGPVLARHATDHLRRYGDRAPGDLKLEQPTPRTRPSMIVDMVRPFVRDRTTVAANRAAEHDARAAAQRELRTKCRDPLRRMVIHSLAGALRWFVKAREDTRFCRTELYGRSRRILFALGARLAETGLLARADDVLDLTVPEVLGAFEGTLAGRDLRGLAALRRAERDRDSLLPEPAARQVTDADTPMAPPRPRIVTAQATGNVLTGLPSCAGVVRARARVVLDPETAPESCRGRVLVARTTDPGWLFLMTAAAGLVVERGTLLSHTAITGRLLGVPTVVAVPGATTRIPDGALIELDGAAGTVRLVEAT
jgi:pyruvate,water dikinase